MSNRLATLEAEQTELNNRIEAAIHSGDLDLYTKLKRAESELGTKYYFEQTKAIREEIAAMEDERRFAIELQADFADELQRQAQVVTDARSALYDAEKGYADIKARQFALDVEIESRRTALTEARKRLDRHVQSRLTGSGDSGIAGVGNSDIIGDSDSIADTLETNFICD